MLDFKNKKYRLRNGNKYEFLADKVTEEPCILGLRYFSDGEIKAIRHYRNGGLYNYDSSPYDLVEIIPYEDFQIDEPVWAYNGPDCKKAGHFAGVSENGNPMTFAEGGTSWTKCKSQTEEWDFVERKEDD